MGASEISGIGSLFTQGQPQSTVAGSKGDTLGQTFRKVIDQIQTPVGGNAPQREPEASSPSYDYKQQGQSKPIKPRDDAAISRDRQEQLGKKLEEFSEGCKGRFVRGIRHNGKASYRGYGDAGAYLCRFIKPESVGSFCGRTDGRDERSGAALQ